VSESQEIFSLYIFHRSYRSTKPKTLCRISAVLVTEAIAYCSVRKMDLEVLNNGVSYFLGPLLNWTLVGVVKALLREIKEKGCVFRPLVSLTHLIN
jgi:hypothetical protein